MTEDRLRQIFSEKEANWLEETSRTALNPQQIIDLLDTQTYFELLREPYPEDRESVLDKLCEEHLIEKVAEQP